MSDRCYMTIQCSKKDYDEVLHEYFAEILEEDGSYVQAAAPPDVDEQLDFPRSRGLSARANARMERLWDRF